MHPLTRATTLPSPQTDRLWVDRDHLAAARDYIDQLSTAAVAELPADQEIEDAFNGIIARYEAEPDDEARPWPASEDVDDDQDGEDDPPSTLRRWSSSTVELSSPQPSLLDGLDTFGAGLPAEDEEGYTPPPPPPLPRFSTPAILAVVSIIVGLVLFFKPSLLETLLGLDSNIAMLLGFLAILAGFVTLVWRLRSGDEDDDHWDPDDGAVV
jgi:hypothetical protein